VLALYPGVERCSCASQEGLAVSAAFVANENPVLAPLGCPRVQYWVVLREPIERIQSRISKDYSRIHADRMALRRAKGIDAFYEEGMLSPAVAKAALRNASWPMWFVRPVGTAAVGGGTHGSWSMCHEFSGTVSLSDWYVRSLNGPAAYRLPVGWLNDWHYAWAEGVLKSAQVVLPSDRMSDLPELLAGLVGVRKEAMPPLETHYSGKKHDEHVTFDAELNSLLVEHNQMDTKLYKYAVSRFEEDMARAEENEKAKAEDKEKAKEKAKDKAKAKAAHHTAPRAAEA